MSLHTSFERGDGLVAIAQGGINGREREFGATQRAILFDRLGDLHRFTPPAHASINSCQRPTVESMVSSAIHQLLRRGKSFLIFSQLLVSVGDATEGRKVARIQFKSALVQRNRFFVLTSAVKNPSFVMFTGDSGSSSTARCAEASASWCRPIA